MTRRLRAMAEEAFAGLEHAVTTLLYPWCLLRARLRRSVRVPILMYHQVGPPLDDGGAGGDRVTPARFEAQMQAIVDAGYRVIRLATLVDAIRHGRVRDLRGAVVLTFDDGLRGQLVFAWPVLRRKRLPATFFIVAGSVGARDPLPHLAQGPLLTDPTAASPAWRPLTADEIRTLAANGVVIGSHALTHRSLGCLRPAERAFELRRSREVLESVAGARVELFAYPFGSPAYGDFDAAAQDDLSAAGYAGACATVVGRAGDDSDPFALPRLPMEAGDGAFRVRCKLAGAYDWVGPVKLLWQRLVPRLDVVNRPLPGAAAPAGVTRHP